MARTLTHCTIRDFHSIKWDEIITNLKHLRVPVFVVYSIRPKREEKKNICNVKPIQITLCLQILPTHLTDWLQLINSDCTFIGYIESKRKPRTKQRFFAVHVSYHDDIYLLCVKKKMDKENNNKNTCWERKIFCS